jgi:hypothetical protein
VTVPESAPYEALLELIERELQLAGEGRFDELVKVAGARAALAETLPEIPPASARETLERAWLTQQRLTIELTRGREALLIELSKLERAQRAAHGYAPVRRRSSRVTASA